jgi:hypothetical protein
MIATARMAARRRDVQTGIFDWAALLFALSTYLPPAPIGGNPNGAGTGFYWEMNERAIPATRKLSEGRFLDSRALERINSPRIAMKY